MTIGFPQLISVLEHYRYAILFPLVVFEGPITTVAAGFLASLGYFQLWIALAVVVAGDVGGDILYYFLGRYGGRRLVDRWGHYIGATPERVGHLERHFEHHAGKTLLLGKLSHGIGGPFLLAAGMAKMPFRRFAWYTFLATLPKSTLLILIGFYFGQSYDRITRYADYSAIGLGVIAVALVIGYFILKKLTQTVSNKEHLS